MLRTAISKLILIGFGFILAIGFFEIVLRLASPILFGDPNPWQKVVGYSPNLNQVRWSTSSNQQKPVLIRYNSKGLREREYSYQKPGGVFRVLILGDSFVEAEQVLFEDTFHEKLEELLHNQCKSSASTFEVIAAGVSGWGTDQAYLFFRNEGYKYQPDLVLLAFADNDIVNNYFLLEAKQEGRMDGRLYKPYFVLEDGQLVLRDFPYHQDGEGTPIYSLKLFLSRYFVSYRLITNTIKKVPPLLKNFLEGNLPRDPDGERNEPYPSIYVYKANYQSAYQSAWGITEILLVSLAEEVRLSGAEFAVFYNGSIFITHPESWEKYQKKYPRLQEEVWDFSRVESMLSQSLEKQDVPFLSLQPVFTQEAAKSDRWFFIPGDGHWNVEGHQLVAETLYQWLILEELIVCDSDQRGVQ
jgi:hypothetical protein